jgi:tripartite-type tricarboxylate transporter receptor subunit TctC
MMCRFAARKSKGKEMKSIYALSRARRLRCLLLLCLVLSGLLPAPSSRAEYPDRPIRVVHGFAPGGGADILLRTFAPALSQRLGQSVIIDYRVGAGGNLAMEDVARAKPDGYTLLLGTPGLAINSSLYAHLAFDPLKDLTAIGMVGSVQNVLIVKPSLPVSSVRELIAYAKKHAGKMNYASSGVGTSLHLAAELFKNDTGTQITHVPYRGGAQAMNGLLGGQVDMMFNVLPSALPQIKAGKVKALAVTGPERSPSLPDVPTMIEAGVPGYTAVTWNGLMAPAGTPRAIVMKINAALNEVLSTPDMRKRFAAIGEDPMTGSPEDFDRLIRAETEKWHTVIKHAGIKAQ